MRQRQIAPLPSKQQTSLPLPSHTPQDQPTTPFPTAVPVTIAAEAGCIFSLRVDDEKGTIDNALRTKARAQLEEFKRQIGEGVSCVTLLSAIPNGTGTTSSVRDQMKAYITARAGNQPATPVTLGETTAYAQFRVSETPNFSFTSPDEISRRIGPFFPQTNPQFVADLAALQAGETGTPFPIYRTTLAGITEYGVMMVSRTK